MLSVASTQTTLWDQFSCSGRPAEFSWILPIQYRPEVQVRIADDAFMAVVDNFTVPSFSAPPRPSPPCCGPHCYGSDAAAYGDAPASAAAPVTSHREEVVGRTGPAKRYRAEHPSLPRGARDRGA